MFWRMLKKSFTTGLRGKLLAIITIAFGASLATAMFTVMLDVGDKINKELKTYGANLVVVPKMDTIPLEVEGIDFDPLADREFIEEKELVKIKTIFWANNIVGFAPYLESPALLGAEKRQVKVVGTWFNKKLELPTGENVETGITQIKPWWEVTGSWVEDTDRQGAMVGTALARELGLEPGEEIELSFAPGGKQDLKLQVRGIFSSGGKEDNQIYVPLQLVQQQVGLAGKVSRVEVSALTTPENELARKAAEDPKSLTSKEYETWYCTAYVSSIAYQIEEVIPGAQAKPVRQVADSEGQIMGKIQLLMLLLTLAALISSALGISSLMTTKVLERSKELGLLKAIGADDGQVVALFVVEAVITGILGGALGYGLGLIFAQIIASSVFATAITIKTLVIPVVLLLAVGITLAGSLSAIRLTIGLRPAEVLHGR